jgi:hypothetical protein
LQDEADVPEVDEGVSGETRYETPAEEVGEMDAFETRSEMPKGEIAVAGLLGTRSEMPAWKGEDGSPTEWRAHEVRMMQQRI